eukprot:TCONS_00034843-protein
MMEEENVSLVDPSLPEEEELFNNKEENDCSLKFNTCKYCRGIIQKNLRRGSSSYCSKICVETNKMVPSETTCPETGKVKLKNVFSNEKDWNYYREVIRDKAAPVGAFYQVTNHVSGIKAGMKIECLDINNPINYCVATIINLQSHRVCLRYDGFGTDPSHDFWCNFQAEELFPIGWCARNNYHLQPPTGITCTHDEWKAFLSTTLTGALAAPEELFKKPENRRQLRCHSFVPGDRVEVIHPERQDLIVPAKVTKSLGPYYFLVTTDFLPHVPSKTIYGYADCPDIYLHGYCESRGLELTFTGQNEKGEMIRNKDSMIENNSKRSRVNNFRLAHKMEAVDGETTRVGTVAEIFGRIAMLVFDGTSKRKFFDKNSTEVHPICWSERTKGCLHTPYGPVDFRNKTVTVGLNPNVKPNTITSAASFKTFQQKTCPGNSASDSPTKPSVGQPVSEDKPSSSCHAMEVMNDSQETSEVEILHGSPASPSFHNALEQKKSDLDQFIVWLLNKYEIDPEDRCSVVKGDLVDSFQAYTNRVLSPRWFTSIYKLFPRVTSTRKLVNDRFVNCLKFLRQRAPEKNIGAVYVKDAVEFLNMKNFAVQLGTDRLVAFVSLVTRPNVPHNTQDIFATGYAPEGSGVFVISATLNSNDFTLVNFTFHFEQIVCPPPIPRLSNFNEFRAAMILCKQASLCNSVDMATKSLSRGRKMANNCSIVAYPHRGNWCVNCKMMKGKTSASTSSSQSQQPPQYDVLSEVLEESLSDDGFDIGSMKDEEDPNLEIKIFFNKTCHPGLLLNPDKISQIAPHTPQEKPPQALKYLIERLIEVSINKDKFLEILEVAFGNRLFNKTKDKVIKKGLFRFNSRLKVLRFIRRLTKYLKCCNTFLSVDTTTQCSENCRGRDDVLHKKKQLDIAIGYMDEHTNHSSPLQRPGKLNPGQTTKPGQPSNVQVLYQLPPSMSSAPHMSSSSPQQQIVVQTSLQQRFPQGTQFFLPQNHGNLTYMVVSNRDKMTSSVQSPPYQQNVPTLNHPQHKNITSPPAAGVTQMLANVTKSNLVSDIDQPNIKSSAHGTMVKREQAMHYDQRPMDDRQEQDVSRSQYGPIVQTKDKGHHIHVHKVQHGNARVKYVEFKPARDGVSAQGGHNTQYYNPSNQQHLSVHTPHHHQQQAPPSSAKSPLHSPPALRPPPALPPRSIALHSPPSLVPSPDVRPRFDYRTHQGVRSPVQVTNFTVNAKHCGGKTILNLPRFVQKNNGTGKPTVLQAFRTMPDKMGPQHSGSSSSIPTTTAVTMTMTYIPIQTTNTNNKLLYVPVHSQSSNHRQPVMLYPGNPPIKNGKPIGLPHQLLQGNKNVLVMPSNKMDGAFTTVRIQGTSQNTVQSPQMTSSSSNVRHPAANEQLKNDHVIGDKPIKIERMDDDSIKRGGRVEEKENENNKRTFQQMSHENHLQNNDLVPVHKKKRGRPPSSSKLPHKSFRPADNTNPITLANRVLKDAFYKKQQQIQNQLQSYIDEPLSKCPELPENPEHWTSGELLKFLSVTDCASFADILKDEEIDGKSFLLLTREALMEFKGIRLGPALKIVGYSAYLRAKSRILNIERVSNRQIHRTPSTHVPNVSRAQMTSQERKDNTALEEFPNSTPTLSREVESSSSKLLDSCQSETITTSKPVVEERTESDVLNTEKEASNIETEAVEFENVPGRHCIEDDIPLQKNNFSDVVDVKSN